MARQVWPRSKVAACRAERETSSVYMCVSELQTGRARTSRRLGGGNTGFAADDGHGQHSRVAAESSYRQPRLSRSRMCACAGAREPRPQLARHRRGLRQRPPRPCSPLAAAMPRRRRGSSRVLLLWRTSAFAALVLCATGESACRERFSQHRSRVCRAVRRVAAFRAGASLSSLACYSAHVRWHMLFVMGTD